MSAVIPCIAALLVLLLGYRVYSRYVADRVFRIQPDEPVPAHTKRDGIDYVPTSRGVLWGHHFASIAGAAPILGPAMAIVWGWVPTLLWICLGVVFIGAVHDFAALVMSARHQGKTIGDITGLYFSKRAKLLFLLIIFFLIWLVGAVFAFAITGLFIAFPASILPVNLEIIVAVALGLWAYKLQRKMLLPSLIILVGLYAVIVLTSSGAIPVPEKGSIWLSPHFWLIGLMVYSFVASTIPVWLLLQPRDLINSHQLVVGLIALFLGFFLTNPEMVAPPVGEVSALPSIVPLLFVTVACGAVSGFHGLVASGTTSKQLDRLPDARPIGYGGMLVEASLAILATMAVAAGAWTANHDHVHAYDMLYKVASAPGLEAGFVLPEVGQALSAFVNGSSSFLASLGLPVGLAATIVAVLVISFAATSLDTSMRIQRLVIAEIGQTFDIKPLQNRWLGGAIACGSVLALIYADFSEGAKSLWPVFGATNQVLAAFTMGVCAIYLKRLDRNALIFAVPAVFIMAITLSAMVFQVSHDLARGQWLVSMVGLAIAVFSAWVAIEGALAWRRASGPGAGPVASPNGPR